VDPHNYKLRRTCRHCSSPICDTTKGNHCRDCFGAGYANYGNGYEMRTPMVISPWRTIEYGVLMRTVEARA
jgi:hypothetical protein